MSGEAWIIHDDQTLEAFVSHVKDTGFAKRWKLKAEGRSLSQNAIAHVWYEQIARTLREDTPEGVKCECKLRLGVPILRAEDEQFRAFYDASIKPMTYEQKLQAMRFVPVTSIMEKSQLSRYLQDMQSHFAGRSVLLEFPGDYSVAQYPEAKR